ncbi:hypothetical protein BaRGS_00011436, partial [Batillaria attramentaria]
AQEAHPIRNTIIKSMDRTVLSVLKSTSSTTRLPHGHQETLLSSDLASSVTEVSALAFAEHIRTEIENRVVSTETSPAPFDDLLVERK